MNGLPAYENDNLINVFKELFINQYLLMDDEKKSSDLIVGDLMKKTIRQIISAGSGKKPEVNSHIIRI